MYFHELDGQDINIIGIEAQAFDETTTEPMTTLKQQNESEWYDINVNQMVVILLIVIGFLILLSIVLIVCIYKRNEMRQLSKFNTASTTSTIPSIHEFGKVNSIDTPQSTEMEPVGKKSFNNLKIPGSNTNTNNLSVMIRSISDDIDTTMAQNPHLDIYFFAGSYLQLLRHILLRSNALQLASQDNRLRPI